MLLPCFGPHYNMRHLQTSFLLITSAINRNILRCLSGDSKHGDKGLEMSIPRWGWHFLRQKVPGQLSSLCEELPVSKAILRLHILF